MRYIFPQENKLSYGAITSNVHKFQRCPRQPVQQGLDRGGALQRQPLSDVDALDRMDRMYKDLW
jgi:hypothetical protein